jgi:hypothetical protein
MKTITIDEAKRIAEEREGSCLSESIENSKDKLEWKCKFGHVWKALFSNVKRGSWCDKCARKASADKRRKNISEIQSLAKSKGGECLSEVYEGAHRRLSFRCANGHVWKATPNNVRLGKWCRICSISSRKSKYSIQDAIHIAKSREGECLTRAQEYKNSKQKLSWKCARGHTWEAALETVLAGHWCKVCGYASSAKKRLKSIVELHQIAESRGGKCLVNEHTGVDRKIPWECSNGHRFEARPSKILKGQWCPTCSGYLGERICREFLSQLFCADFPKARPNWLLSENGFRLELDGYNPFRRIAFEHHGTYHYQIDKLYSKTEEAVQKRQITDSLKTKLCNARNIRIITIPELFRITSLSDLPKVVLEQCQMKGISLPEGYEEKIKNIDLSKAYKCPFALEEMGNLRRIAEANGGECLSETYIASSEKMIFKCAKGHVFLAVPNSIKRGSWCYTCNGNITLTIEEMKDIARSRGGECLSENYTNCHTKLTWMCAKGHIWDAVPNTIKHRGSWCPFCAKDRRAPDK